MSIDVVFKWAQCKMAESSNTTFQSQLFDFYYELLVFMPEIKYTLWDHEAMILIPWLCIQAGGNNKTICDKVKTVIKKCFDVYDHKQMMKLIFQYGLKHKNQRCVAECIDELTSFLKEDGLDKFTEKDL